MMGAERKSAVITPESRLKTAYHEAGHALAAYYSEHADPVHKVTVLPRGHALGITFQYVARSHSHADGADYHPSTATRSRSCSTALGSTSAWADGRPRRSSTGASR